MNDFIKKILLSVKQVMEEEIEKGEKAGLSLEIAQHHAYKQGKARLYRLINASQTLYPNLSSLLDLIKTLISCVTNYYDLNYVVEMFED